MDECFSSDPMDIILSINATVNAHEERIKAIDKIFRVMQKEIGFPSSIIQAETITTLHHYQKRQSWTEEEYQTLMDLTKEKRDIKWKVEELELERERLIPRLCGKINGFDMSQQLISAAIGNVFLYFISQTDEFQKVFRIMDSRKKSDQVMYDKMVRHYEGLEKFLEMYLEDPRLYKCDNEWIFSDNSESDITFSQCCEEVDIDPDKIRLALCLAKKMSYQQLSEIHGRCVGNFIFEVGGHRAIEEDVDFAQ